VVSAVLGDELNASTLKRQKQQSPIAVSHLAAFLECGS
jgi:hypothetical protein